ncbi:MAG: biopolymer transporter ExbD [Gammaproteobacteria bacterium]|nr:biopolymer transporter ExbD [Gammaproteobacteria bacterium]NIR99250.1 biopolymer transporter ExbD [Gammaproteobacteria bacterium]NIT64871.1 biopolymer transporter ExbD [Gammaproteobacteria bacterium]NIV21821.1 biopolymer transporter ExbD [Gammaproteobacteria bacterium]NIX10890.1 biopolymer transporter ExbD [Gammaproteobacteria bacterium]
MRLEGRPKASRVPNLTPLIDIVFLLLVFFMLTSHFVREQALGIELPESSSGASLEPAPPVEVAVDQYGVVRMDDRVLAPEELVAVLRQALQQRTDKVVRVRGDRAAALGAAVNVLDAAQEAGAEAVDLVTLER